MSEFFRAYPVEAIKIANTKAMSSLAETRKEGVIKPNEVKSSLMTLGRLYAGKKLDEFNFKMNQLKSELVKLKSENFVSAESKLLLKEMIEINDLESVKYKEYLPHVRNLLILQKIQVYLEESSGNTGKQLYTQIAKLLIKVVLENIPTRTITRESGDVLEGQFDEKDNLREGTIRYADGRVYTGIFDTKKYHKEILLSGTKSFKVPEKGFNVRELEKFVSNLNKSNSQFANPLQFLSILRKTEPQEFSEYMSKIQNTILKNYIPGFNQSTESKFFMEILCQLDTSKDDHNLFLLQQFCTRGFGGKLGSVIFKTLAGLRTEAVAKFLSSPTETKVSDEVVLNKAKKIKVRSVSLYNVVEKKLNARASFAQSDEANLSELFSKEGFITVDEGVFLTVKEGFFENRYSYNPESIQTIPFAMPVPLPGPEYFFNPKLPLKRSEFKLDHFNMLKKLNFYLEKNDFKEFNRIMEFIMDKVSPLKDKKFNSDESKAFLNELLTHHENRSLELDVKKNINLLECFEKHLKISTGNTERNFSKQLTKIINDALISE